MVHTKPPKKVSLTIVYQEQYESSSKSFIFSNDEKGKLKCRAKLNTLLDHVYADLESDPDGKYENEKGKRVFIDPKYARELYDYDMVWDDLVSTGTTDKIHLKNGVVYLYLS